jgi:glyoxylate carboligase
VLIYNVLMDCFGRNIYIYVMLSAKIYGNNAVTYSREIILSQVHIYHIFRSITRTPNFFDIPFDVQITRVTLTSGRVRNYRPLLTEDTGVILKNVPV